MSDISFRWGLVKKIMTTLVRSILEYASVVLSPCMKSNSCIRKLKRIHRIATKMIPELSGLIRDLIGATGSTNL